MCQSVCEFLWNSYHVWKSGFIATGRILALKNLVSMHARFFACNWFQLSMAEFFCLWRDAPGIASSEQKLLIQPYMATFWPIHRELAQGLIET
jgi:hypothetical protein